MKDFSSFRMDAMDVKFKRQIVLLVLKCNSAEWINQAINERKELFVHIESASIEGA